MSHLTEEQLVLHYYGEDTEASGHLELCPDCRAEYREIARVLDACRDVAVPELADSFETLTWQKLAPQLISQQRSPWRRAWVWAPVLAALLIAAFFMGRVSTVKGPLAQAIPPQGRERILLVALGDHLQRSQMVLVELANARPSDVPGIRLTQERARDLVNENRLYRQTALWSGDQEFLGVLDELERVLTDVANGSAGMSAPELRQIQERIESRGLIFRIRVIDSNLQRKGSEQL